MTQARKDSNLQPAVLETVALPVGATGLFFHFLVNSMLAFRRTIFLKLDTLGLFLLVFHARVIDALAFGTLEMDNFSHGANHSVQKPSTGLEPVASSLPRTCSTN